MCDGHTHTDTLTRDRSYFNAHFQEEKKIRFRNLPLNVVFGDCSVRFGIRKKKMEFRFGLEIHPPKKNNKLHFFSNFEGGGVAVVVVVVVCGVEGSVACGVGLPLSYPANRISEIVENSNE